MSNDKHRDTTWDHFERLARIEQKLDDLKEQVLSHAEKEMAVLSDHETRIRSVEGLKQRILGISAFVAFLVGTATDWFTTFINRSTP